MGERLDGPVCASECNERSMTAVDPLNDPRNPVMSGVRRYQIQCEAARYQEIAAKLYASVLAAIPLVANGDTMWVNDMQKEASQAAGMARFCLFRALGYSEFIARDASASRRGYWHEYTCE